MVGFRLSIFLENTLLDPTKTRLNLILSIYSRSLVSYSIFLTLLSILTSELYFLFLSKHFLKSLTLSLLTLLLIYFFSSLSISTLFYIFHFTFSLYSVSLYFLLYFPSHFSFHFSSLLSHLFFLLLSHFTCLCIFLLYFLNPIIIIGDS